MVAQLGQKERAGYEIGRLLPRILKLHEQAWLSADRDASDSLSANLSRIADDLATMRQSALAAQARDLEADWRKCFFSPEHLAWSATWEVASHLADRKPKMPKAVVAVMAIDLVFRVAYGEPESRPTLSVEAAEDIIRNGRQGDRKSMDVDVIRDICEALVPSRRHSETRVRCAVGHPQDPDEWNRQLARMVLEDVSSLFLSGCFLGDPSEPVPSPVYSTWNVARARVLTQSLIANEVGRLCAGVSGVALEGWGMGSIWFRLGLHLALLETTPLLLPDSVAKDYSGEWLDRHQEHYGWSLSTTNWTDSTDNPRLVRLARDEVGRLPLTDYAREKAEKPDDPDYPYQWAVDLGSAIVRDLSLAPLAASAPYEKTLEVKAFPDTWTIEFRIPEGDRRTDLELPDAGGKRWGDRYTLLRTLLLQLGTDLDKRLADPETGWVSYSDLDPKSKGKASKGLKTAVSRLNDRLGEPSFSGAPALPLCDLLKVSDADKSRRAYRLEGRVLVEHWALKVDLPPPGDA